MAYDGVGWRRAQRADVTRRQKLSHRQQQEVFIEMLAAGETVSWAYDRFVNPR